MGTDIYVFLEVQRDDGTWESRDEWQDGHVVDPIEIDRDYALFAILAGIRNGRRGKFSPIAQGRDLPEDVSPLVKQTALHKANRFGQDDHPDVSPLTWLRLDEFYKYPHWKDVILYYPEPPSSFEPYPTPVWQTIGIPFWFSTLMEIGKRTCDVAPNRVRLILAFSD